MRLPFLVLVSLVTAGGAAPARAQPAPSCRGTVDGHVVDVVTHLPLAGVAVRVDGTPAAISDSDGRFALRGLCPGDIVIAAERPDYLADERPLHVDGDVSIELTLVALAPTEVIELVSDAPPDIELRSTATKTGEALARTRGRAFSDALADLPGVAPLRSGSGAAKPIIRGQFGRRLLILLDGVRHRSQGWGLDHAPEIDPFVAAALTVVRGASGVKLGPDAIGGAVLVEPPALLTAPGTAGELHLVGLTNTHGASLAARIQHAPAGLPGSAGQLEGSVRRAGGIATPGYPLDNTGAFEWNAGATVGYRRGGTYKLSYRHYQADLGVCSCLRIDSIEQFRAQLDRAEPIGVESYRSDLTIDRPYQAVAHDLALARASWTRANLGTFTASYAFQHDVRDEFDVVRQATTGSQFHFRLFTHDLDLAFEHRTLHLSDHLHLHGSAGVVAMAQTHRYRGLQLVPGHQAAAAGLYAIERLRGHDYEVEAGARLDVLARTAAIAVRDFTRLVRSGQIAEDACGTLPTGDPDATVDCASTFVVPSLSLGALYQLSPAWSAKVELSTSSRPPDPDEQYLNGTAPTFPVLGLGKPDLGAETAYAGSATLAVERPGLRGEVSIHGTAIDDYVYFAPAIGADGQPIFDTLIRGTFPRFVTRPVDAVFYGADGGITARPLPWLELGGQATLVRARNRTDDGYLVFVPPDRADGSVTVRRERWAGARDLYAMMNGTYVAHQGRFDLRADLAPPPPAYFVVGAEVGLELHDGDRIIEVAAQGSNLTNARHRDYTSLLRYFADQPGWEVLLRLSVQFQPSPNP